MTLYQVKNYNEMSRKAANIISAEMIINPSCVLGLATGSTPLQIYQQLIQWHQKGDLDFADIKTVNLDEYKGLSENNKHSYHYYMNQQLFQHVNVKQENTYLPNGMEENTEYECKRYDRVIRDLGGVDLQLLGLGHNGHIGFNEPSDKFEKGTNCVKLTQSTLEANSRLFEEGETVPLYAYTMGIHTIMQAKKILLVVSGKDKAKALSNALTGSITPEVPASILQLHKNLIVVADEDALTMLDVSSLNRNINAVGLCN